MAATCCAARIDHQGPNFHLPLESRCVMDVDDWPLTGDCGDTECLIPKRAADRRRDLMRRLNELCDSGNPADRPVFASGGIVTSRMPTALPFWGGTP